MKPSRGIPLAIPCALRWAQVISSAKCFVFRRKNDLRYGAARESALKMLEMTAGRVITLSETYLGLRHGPMSSVHPDTFIVCFLSSDPQIRGYESDLIRELNRTLEMTVIMVTHERSLAERYANRLVFLGDGKLVGELKNTRLEKIEKEKIGVRG